MGVQVKVVVKVGLLVGVVVIETVAEGVLLMVAVAVAVVVSNRRPATAYIFASVDPGWLDATAVPSDAWDATPNNRSSPRLTPVCPTVSTTWNRNHVAAGRRTKSTGLVYFNVWLRAWKHGCPSCSKIVTQPWPSREHSKRQTVGSPAAELPALSVK